MYKIFLKIVFLVFILTNTIYANNQTNINQELNNIKLKLEKVKLSQKYINQNKNNQISQIILNIKKLEDKINNQNINKDLIKKDFDKYNEIINRQDKNIERLGLDISHTGNLIGFLGILITAIIIFFSFKSEGTAKSQASKEIQEWIDKKADDEFKGIIEEYKKDFNKHIIEAKDSVDNIKSTEKDIKTLYNNLSSKSENITKEKKQELKQNSEDIKEKTTENNRTIEQWEELFLSAYFEKDYDNAIKYSKEIIKIHPKNADTYNNMGIVYDNKEDYDNAIDSYKKAIQINPKNDEAYNNIGITYDNKEDYDNAIDSYKKSIQINPKNHEAYSNMGVTYATTKDYDNAINSYKKSIEINPKYATAYANLFELQIIQNQIINIDLEQKYISLFEKEKDVFIKYKMLKILLDISQNKEVDIDRWSKDYEKQNLNGWSFKELDDWIDTKDGEIKDRLLDAINIFKSKS